MERLKQKNFKFLPSKTYIAKIINSLGFTKKKKQKKYQSFNTYPLDLLINKGKELILALDFWGPKSLDTKEVVNGLVLSLNMGDKRMIPIESKTTNELIDKFTDFLQLTGHIPNYLQSDNDSSITGNVAGRLNMGRFTKLCLNLKITPILIPEGEPYYNGQAEGVIGLFARKVWRHKYFKDKKAVQKAMLSFSHEYCKRLSRQKSIPLTKRGIIRNKNIFLTLSKYSKKELTEKLFPFCSRKIIFLRLVRERFEYDYSSINILSHHIEIPKKYTGFYVIAAYDVRKKVMSIFIKTNKQLRCIKKIQLAIDI